MSVSGVAGGASSCGSSDCEMTREVLVVKKQQDVQKTEAQALLSLIKQTTEGVGQRINVLA